MGRSWTEFGLFKKAYDSCNNLEKDNIVSLATKEIKALALIEVKHEEEVKEIKEVKAD